MARNPAAAAKLGIPVDNKAILCLDGGGIRGVMTIQLLLRMEAITGVKCCDLFDMVAGTSTGGIIAGLIAAGKSAQEIDTLYTKFVKLVFTKMSWHASRFVDPPAYTKAEYRTALKETLGDITLQQAAGKTGIDLLITTKDVAEGEETYFSCLSDGKGAFTGYYQDVLLRAAMEATMSAPTYFTPLERFVDGGTTTYNNPTMAALTETLKYGPAGKYAVDKLTLLSFGTGYRQQFIAPAQVPNPPGADVLFWLQWVMSESGSDASDMQTYFLRGNLCQGLDFRRFQISLDEVAIQKLPNRPLHHVDPTNADWLHDLTDQQLSTIEMDNVAYFDVMREIGIAMADFIVAQGAPPFGTDLIDMAGKELLVTRQGDKQRILAQMSDPNWFDHFQP